MPAGIEIKFPIYTFHGLFFFYNEKENQNMEEDMFSCWM